MLPTDAQLRADAIKARRQARKEDVFDTRPVLAVVPPVACGYRRPAERGQWVCVAEQHPESPHHYFVKDAP